MLDDYDSDGILPADSAGHSSDSDTRPSPKGFYQDDRYGDPMPGLPIDRRSPTHSGSTGDTSGNTQVGEEVIW